MAKMLKCVRIPKKLDKQLCELVTTQKNYTMVIAEIIEVGLYYRVEYAQMKRDIGSPSLFIDDIEYERGLM